jgi:hypothetical protein
VVQNYAILLGLGITPSKQAGSHELFYRSMMDIDNELAKVAPQVEAEGSEPSEWISPRQVQLDPLILNDAETGLLSFVQIRGMRHLLCVRHILEPLG